MKLANVLLMRAVVGTVGAVLLALCFFVALRGGLSALAGVPRTDAAVTAGLLAFLAWTIAALTSFTSRSAVQAGAWVYGASAVFAVIGWACADRGGALA